LKHLSELDIPYSLKQIRLYLRPIFISFICIVDTHRDVTLMKVSHQVVGYQRRYKCWANTPRCYVIRILPIVFFLLTSQYR